jgi:hypothetical protein
VTVLLPGGEAAEIGHRPVTHLEKILGVVTSPDGNSSRAIRMMQEKVQQWVDSV